MQLHHQCHLIGNARIWVNLTLTPHIAFAQLDGHLPGVVESAVRILALTTHVNSGGIPLSGVHIEMDNSGATFDFWFAYKQIFSTFFKDFLKLSHYSKKSN